MHRPVCLLMVLSAAVALAGCGANGLPGMPRFDPAATSAGNTPSRSDALARAQRDFRNRNFGLAEQRYQKLVEAQPTNANAWLGLGATHDELARFDLADQDYAQVAKLAGQSPELLNDMGYSHMMRGDLVGARRYLLKAHALAPTNPFITNNLRLLAKRQRQTAPGSKL